MSPAPRAIIVGAGLMGRWHAHACLRAGGRIVAIVDTDQRAAQSLAARHARRAQVASKLTDVLSALPADVAHVCTPEAAHLDVALAALQHGVPVIVEKPVARSLAETRQVIDAAALAGVWVLPVHQLLFQRGIRRALRWAQHQQIRSVEYHAFTAGAVGTGRDDAIVAEILPHPLSLLERWAGDAFDLASLQWDVHHLDAGELALATQIGGTAVHGLISTHGRPPRHDFTLVGDRGTMTVDLFHGFAALSPAGRVMRVSKIVEPFAAAARTAAGASVNLLRRLAAREFAYPGLDDFVAHAYTAIGRTELRPLSDEHTLRVAACRDNILSRAGHG